MLTGEEKYREISVRQKLAQFLESRKMRKTSERFTILDKIYSSSAHVEVVALHNAMLSDGYRVSIATVYNTLNLLVEAGLVRRINLGDGVARYERITATNNHHHLICTRCGKVKEMKAVELVGDLLSRKPRSFEPAYFTLYIYGLCSRCAKQERDMRRKEKK
ncbi:MAG: transcriptional repressor [Bacteroidaceae bacterium]|nr:transcriptional repressor [Bacteroidaceae bacterium]